MFASIRASERAVAWDDALQHAVAHNWHVPALGPAAVPGARPKTDPSSNLNIPYVLEKIPDSKIKFVATIDRYRVLHPLPAVASRAPAPAPSTSRASRSTCPCWAHR
ncbi:hypothetical protein EJB05_49414, partial [Eragrostis curvula]